MRALKIALSIPVILLFLLLGGCGTFVTAQEAHSNTHSQTAMSTTHPLVTPTTTRLLKPQPDIIADPVRLVIPAIGVNATVETVGILNNGDLATPTRSPWTDVGWFVSGPQPGDPGSAVIDGHLDRPGGYPAVFWNLRYMQVGERVTVVSANGKTLNFQVTRVAFYAPQAAPIQAIFGNSGGTYLNLITCAGDWIPSQHQTTLRQVVYTTLV
ncbi:MAG: class F sortase [Ktedonobacteraceae bacterium]